MPTVRRAHLRQTRRYARRSARSSGATRDRALRGSRSLGVAKILVAILADEPSEVFGVLCVTVGQKDVLRLQVSVNDPSPMRGREPVGDLNRDIHRPPRRKRGTLEPRTKCLPFEKFGDGVSDALGRPEIVQGEDIRVVQCGNRPRPAGRGPHTGPTEFRGSTCHFTPCSRGHPHRPPRRPIM